MQRHLSLAPRLVLALSPLLAGAVLGVAAHAPSSLTVGVGELEGAEGTTVEVPIDIRDAVQLGALQLDLIYDPSILRSAGLEPGAAAREFTLDSHVVAPGRLRVVMNSSARESMSGSGVLARAAFEVLGAAGDGCALGLERVRAWDNARPDALPAEMLVTVEPGRFDVANPGGPPTMIFLGAGAAVVVLLGAGALRRRSRPAAAADGGTTPCPKCGVAVARGARFCSSCGTAAGP